MGLMDFIIRKIEMVEKSKDGLLPCKWDKNEFPEIQETSKSGRWRVFATKFNKMGNFVITIDCYGKTKKEVVKTWNDLMK